jgi:hypothetical protein
MGALAFGGVRDVVLGKKAPKFAPTKHMELDPTLARNVGGGRDLQVYAMEKARERAQADTGGLVRSQIAGEQRGLRAAGEDAQRQLAGNIAQRGLGRSSIGLNAAAELSRQTGIDQANVASSFAQRQDAMERQRNMDQLSVANQVLGTPGAQRAVMKGGNQERSGGLLGAAARIAGPVAKALT